MPGIRNNVAEQTSPELAVSIPAIMLFQAAALIIRSFVQIKLIDSGRDVIVAKHLSALIGFGVLAMLMWPIIRETWPVVRGQFRRPASWSRMILTSAALGTVLWLGQMLALLLYSTRQWIDQGPYHESTSPVYMIACENPAILLLAIPVMSLLTPVVEEVINRGLILQKSLIRGRTLAILISALLFAVLHEPGGIPFAFVFGIFVAVQMLHCRNLWAVVITHGVANLMSIVSNLCVSGFWLPGQITWSLMSPPTLIILSLTACLVAASRLATLGNAGTDIISARPGYQ